jgi:hypothetical protein
MLRLAVFVGTIAGLFLATASWGVEDLAPVFADRTVRLNLAIDDLEPDTLIQLKRKSDGVVAETLKPLPEKLEFEVIVAGPHGEIPVSFPVPRHSPVCQAYHTYKDTDPAKILEAMDRVRRPIVRVIAVRTPSAAEIILAGHQASSGSSFYSPRSSFYSPRSSFYSSRPSFPLSDPSSYWKPFYEVFLPDADCSTPVLVPVPRCDQALHRLATQAVNVMLAPQDVVLVTQISGGNDADPCCPQCTSDTPVESPPCPHCSGAASGAHAPCPHSNGKDPCGCGQPPCGGTPSGQPPCGQKMPCKTPCGRSPCPWCAGKPPCGPSPCPHGAPAKCAHCD